MIPLPAVGSAPSFASSESPLPTAPSSRPSRAPEPGRPRPARTWAHVTAASADTTVPPTGHVRCRDTARDTPRRWPRSQSWALCSPRCRPYAWRAGTLQASSLSPCHPSASPGGPCWLVNTASFSSGCPGPTAWGTSLATALFMRPEGSVLAFGMTFRTSFFPKVLVRL